MEEKEETLEQDKITEENVEGNLEENVETEVVEESVSVQEYQNVQKEKDEVYQRFLRLQADYENFKRRTIKEREADRKYRSQDLIQDILPVLDNFERALQIQAEEASFSQFVDGMKMVYNQLRQALVKEGIEEIGAEGQPFDPNFHQAVMQVQDPEQPPNTIVEVFQKGYRLKDRVIRPAMVKVNE
ncbi:nucleotide exchange factor GrpE [Bacillaceae bacterium S4-13-58]